MGVGVLRRQKVANFRVGLGKQVSGIRRPNIYKAGDVILAFPDLWNQTDQLIAGKIDIQGGLAKFHSLIMM